MPSAPTINKVDSVARTFNPLKASADGSLPDRIELLKVGMWDTPYHGMFMITPEDCTEMVTNFNAGIGLPGQGSIGAPIDFGHDSAEKAAGWIKGLEFDGTTLWGVSVEWTDAGKAALLSGEYKCFSPEFYPGCFAGWEDPEQYGVYVKNVLVGGGLTNIPLFKGLKPIVASAANGTVNADNRNVIYIKADATKELPMPTIEELRARNFENLTADEKKVVAENQAELTAEEKTQFGFDKPADPAPVVVPAADDNNKNEGDPVVTPVADQEAAAVAASVKSGESVVIKASDLTALKATAASYEREKAEAIVRVAASRGAITADAIGRWTDRLVAASGQARADLEKDLADLPTHEAMKDANGSDQNAGVAASSYAEIMKRANEKVKASAEAGNPFTQIDAISQVRKEDPELAKAYDQEVKTNA